MTKTIKKAPAETEALANESTAIVAQNNQIVNQEADIDGFLAKRVEFIEKVNAIMVEGKDYHLIQNKKSLAKGGAEKIASIFNWGAMFKRDKDTMEMLGDIKGTLVYVCTLYKRSQSFNEDSDNVGEGRGASTLQKNNGDVNKAIKMAQKSAYIDAVIRASGLSDFFTQDLENMDIDDIKKPFDKLEWQRNNRNQFKQEHGYSQTTHYRFDGIRDEVLKRDNYSCVWCGMTDEQHKKEWNKPITVDHMDKNENNNTLENLQTLCLRCHGKKDISPELKEPQVPEDKEAILGWRKEGKTYQEIADLTGYSIGAVWKWIQRWNAPIISTRKPSEKQAKLIKDLAIQKKLTQAQIIEMASGKTPSQLIDALFQYKAYEQKEELPVIQQDNLPATVMTEEEKEMVDGINF